MVKTDKTMVKVLGLTKNNDQYEDVPDELKWAIPLHEHLTSPPIQTYFNRRKALSEQRVQRQVSILPTSTRRRKPKTLTLLRAIEL